jgi:hypothetical protein
MGFGRGFDFGGFLVGFDDLGTAHPFACHHRTNTADCESPATGGNRHDRRRDESRQASYFWVEGAP